MAGAWQGWQARAREYVVGDTGARKRRRRLVDNPLRAPGRGRRLLRNAAPERAIPSPQQTRDICWN